MVRSHYTLRFISAERLNLKSRWNGLGLGVWLYPIYIKGLNASEISPVQNEWIDKISQTAGGSQPAEGAFEDSPGGVVFLDDPVGAGL